MTIRPTDLARGAKRRPARCAWCRRTLPLEAARPGRPREYCRRSCRQRAYEARSRAAELGVGEDELILARAAHEELLDRLDVLRRALADVDADLASGTDDPKLLREALLWLRDAAAGAVGR